MNQNQSNHPISENGWFEPVIQAIDCLLKDTEEPVLVGIDGKCAAGKTTLGEYLKSKYECNLFHMDDFFLQPEQRTPKRLAEVGGNVDYERFKTEVIEPLAARTDVFYRPFRCNTRKIVEGTVFPFQRLTIIEGSYSLHPYFGQPYQLKVFMDINDRSQLDRILKRNGEQMLLKFQKEWIPKENDYFRAFHIAKECSIKLTWEETLSN